MLFHTRKMIHHDPTNMAVPLENDTCLPKDDDQ